MQAEAVATGRRWDFCAKGYSDNTKKEFIENYDAFDTLIRENAPEGAERALDVGTGPGFFAMLLSMQGFDTVGIDCSEKMVQQAEINAKAHGLSIDFETMDSHDLKFEDNSFDYIVARNATWLLYDPEKAFSEWLRVLTPGGRLLYLDANWCYRDDPELVKKLKEAEDRFEKKNGRSFNTYTGDEDTDTTFKKTLWFEHTFRPKWDEETLPLLGYTNLRIIQRMNEIIYTPWKQELYDCMNEFMVVAEKPR